MTLPLNQAVDTFEFTAAVLEFLSICASLSALELSLISPFALLSLAAHDLCGRCEGGDAEIAVSS